MLSASPSDAHEHVHAPGRLREEDRRLAGRVAAADDDHLLAGAELRLHERRAVVHAGALEPRQVRQGQLPVLGARGDDHRARRDARAPSSISIAYGFRLHASCWRASRDHRAAAPNFCACV